MKLIKVDGFVMNALCGIFKPEELTVRISNDSRGKTLSIDNGEIQFTVPFEPIEKAMKERKHRY